ncbi:MAG: hypothetical protein ACRD1S_10900, partial [Vicinamibacterales bacterium]
GPGEMIEVTSDTTVARVGEETIRLWPGGEPGVFRGVFPAPGIPGMLTVAAERDGARADATAAVDRAAAHPWPDRDAGLEDFATAHGGRFVTANDLDPLVTALRQVAAPRPAARTVRPMRHPWWIAPFATLLAAEWTLRRRRHLH